MPERPFLSQGSTRVHIETPTPGTAGEAALSQRCTRAVQELAREFGQALGELKDAAPDEVLVEFGLGVADDGQFVVLRGLANANVVVKLRWGGSTPGLLPGLPIQE